MAIDLIKSYLVGLGFKIDEKSFENMDKSMKKADKTIKDFNENSKKGFSKTDDSLKGLFDLMGTFSDVVGRLFPELQSPFKSFIKDIILMKKLYSDFSKIDLNQKTEVKQENETNKKSTEHKTNKKNTETVPNNTKALSTIPQNTEIIDSSKNLVENILRTKDAAKKLEVEGGTAFKLFSKGALGPIAAVVAGTVAITLATKKLYNYLDDLANQDIEYEKLSRQLWTTKETAKEVDMALKTMGVSMQDLWLSPTLLKQFNQLRKDSSTLKLPKEYTENLKVIQNISLEFKRLKQLGTLAFQWIGNYILKYAAAPLNELKNGIRNFNNDLVKGIPGASKAIGSIIGVLIRIISIIIKIGLFIFKLSSPIFRIINLIKYFSSLFDKLPEPAQKTLKMLALLIVGLVSPIIIVIGLLDDLMTYFNGGQSLTGTLIDKFNKKLDEAGKKIKTVVDYFKNLKKEILNSDFAKWIEGLGEGFKKGIEINKGDFKALISDVNIKVKDFDNPNIDKIPASYSTNTNTTNTNSITTQNSNNSVKNENKIYVYGGTDSNSTAKTIKNNITGLTIRSFQGGL